MFLICWTKTNFELTIAYINDTWLWALHSSRTSSSLLFSSRKKNKPKSSLKNRPQNKKTEKEEEKHFPKRLNKIGHFVHLKEFRCHWLTTYNSHIWFWQTNIKTEQHILEKTPKRKRARKRRDRWYQLTTHITISNKKRQNGIHGIKNYIYTNNTSYDQKHITIFLIRCCALFHFIWVLLRFFLL